MSVLDTRLVQFAQAVGAEFDNLNALSFVTPQKHGAVGDGVTDDTAAIQAALNEAGAIAGLSLSTGGAKVYFPAGTYLCSSALNVPANVTLEGDGRVASWIKFTHAGSNARTGSGFYSEFAINSSSPANIRITGLGIENTNGSNLGAAYYDQGGTYIVVDHCELRGFKYGVIFDQSELCDIDLCNINSQLAAGVWLVDGAELNGSASAGFTNRISVKRCQFNQGATVYGILDDGGTSHAFDDNNYNGCLNHIRIACCFGVSIRGGEFEAAASHCVNIQLATLSGAVSGGSAVFVDGGFYTATSGHAAINCGSGVGTLGVGGSASFAGGGGTHPIVGAANLFNLWIGSNANFTAVTLADGQAANTYDTTGAPRLVANATTPGTGFITTPSMVATTTTTADGKVVTASVDHGSAGAQVYLQSELRHIADGYSDFVVRTRFSDGMGERGRFNETGLLLPSGEVIKINGTQVVSSRQTGTPADATDLATALTLVNALKAKLVAHGLIS